VKGCHVKQQYSRTVQELWEVGTYSGAGAEDLVRTQTIARATGYLPSFDGWRAVAILCVLMTHDLPWVVGDHSNAAFKDEGGYGVALFFAISGILITTRILEEERIVGRFDIRRFYIRRFFRIQPVAIFYLALIAALMIFHVIHDHWFFWLGAMFMFENFLAHPWLLPVSFFVRHFWSLAVEEHFYILLSLLLLILRKSRLTVLTAIWFTLFVLAKIGAGRGFYDPAHSSLRTYWQLDFLIFAAMAALVLQRPGVKKWAVRYWKPWTAFVVTIAIVCLHRWSVSVRHAEPDPFSLMGWMNELGLISQFFFTLWVVATMLHPQSWTTWLLELPPLRFIGRLSYSIYIWHLLFFFRIEPATHITNPVLLALSGRPMKYIAAFGVSALSYYVLEKPMMRLGHRLAPPATPGRPELIDQPSSS
jgi:peptidoglycan/LPS O-acetylase OafA/YrhL